MRCGRTLRVIPLVCGLVAGLATHGAVALDVYESEDGSTRFYVAGYVQPYVRWVENPCTYSTTSLPPDPCTENVVPDGFGLTRARIGLGVSREGLGALYVELRTVPNVELLEARLDFEPFEGFQVSAGRFRVPFSQQELTSESRLQLIDRASLISSTPGRQLGVALSYETGFGIDGLAPDMLGVSVGVFNGESAKERAPINNIDEDFLYGARLRVSPWGAPPLAEGDLRPAGEREQLVMSLGASWTLETRGPENGDYRQQRLGADLLAAWQGVFVYGEYYRFDLDYARDETSVDHRGEGWNVQAGVMVPAPYLREHLEVAGRVEYWDPQTARDAERERELLSPVAGSGPARPGGSTQATRSYVAGVNWYFTGHDLKLQANYTHREGAEPWELSAENPEVPAEVGDDTFFLQLTYRL